MDHAQVHVAIDLDEIERPERDVDVELGDRKRQRHRVGPQRRHAVGAARLQQDRQPVVAHKFDECAAVGVRQGPEIAQGQRHGVVAGRDLDLRDVGARLEAADQRAELGDAQAHRRQQRVALAEVGDEARIVLAEADHHLVLLGHPLDRQASLAAIAPRFAREWFEPARRCHLADALEVFGQHILLGRDLRRGRQVLHAASAAGAEMRAAWLDALRRAHE